jgi:hypothetical protein
MGIINSYGLKSVAKGGSSLFQCITPTSAEGIYENIKKPYAYMGGF